MGDRSAEEGHDGVADELLHGAAESLEVGTQTGVEGCEQRAHVLRVEPFRPGGEAGQVDEDCSDDLPLLATSGKAGGERRPAVRAERELSRELLPAAWAVHLAECRRGVVGKHRHGTVTSAPGGPPVSADEDQAARRTNRPAAFLSSTACSLPPATTVSVPPAAVDTSTAVPGARPWS